MRLVRPCTSYHCTARAVASLQDTLLLVTAKGTMADFATLSLGAPAHGNLLVANAKLESSLRLNCVFARRNGKAIADDTTQREQVIARGTVIGEIRDVLRD